MQFTLIGTALGLASVAVAVPTGGPATPAPIPASQCNTDPILCCNSTQDAKSPGLAAIFALLGLNVGDITGLVGVTCSPISVIGLPGTSCSAQPVCCTNITFNGIVALNCTAII